MSVVYSFSEVIEFSGVDSSVGILFFLKLGHRLNYVFFFPENSTYIFKNCGISIAAVAWKL